MLIAATLCYWVSVITLFNAKLCWTRTETSAVALNFAVVGLRYIFANIFVQTCNSKNDSRKTEMGNATEQMCSNSDVNFWPILSPLPVQSLKFLESIVYLISLSMKWTAAHQLIVSSRNAAWLFSDYVVSIALVSSILRQNEGRQTCLSVLYMWAWVLISSQLMINSRLVKPMRTGSWWVLRFNRLSCAALPICSVKALFVVPPVVIQIPANDVLCDVNKRN